MIEIAERDQFDSNIQRRKMQKLIFISILYLAFVKANPSLLEKQQEYKNRVEKLRVEVAKYSQEKDKDPAKLAQFKEEALALRQLRSEIGTKTNGQPKKKKNNKKKSRRNRRKMRKRRQKRRMKKAFKLFWRWLQSSKKHRRHRQEGKSRKTQKLDLNKSRELAPLTWGSLNPHK